MNKNDIKELFKELEAEQALEKKAAFSFRIDHATLEQFKKTCKSQGHSAASVIEKLIQKFLRAE